MPNVESWLEPSLNSMGPESAMLNRISGALARKSAAPTPQFTELGLSLDMKLRLINKISGMIQEKQVLVLDQEYKENNIFKQGSKDSFALPIDQNLLLFTVVYIHAFFFEVDSAFEILKKYIEELHKCLNKDITDIKSEITKILDAGAIDVHWISRLDSHRNYFVHAGAAFFVIDITDPKNKELIITKKNITDFSKAKEYIRWSELESVGRGFADGVKLILEHMYSLVNG